MNAAALFSDESFTSILDKIKDQMYDNDIKMISNRSALPDETQDGVSQKKEGIVWGIKVNIRKRKN